MPAHPPQPVEVPRIQRLSDELINQIAAGEVVERPASALKEIVENSLDAGSSRIDIFLRQGGMQEILVIDNGWGIEREDLLLCPQRHTTSKISKFTDLDNMGTYGFRGEALSSISSVAEVEIRSRTQSHPHAYVVHIRHGKIEDEIRPAAGPVGTSIKIQGLFDQIPARQKFLRSAATEFAHCARVVRELAMGNAQAFLTLHHEERQINAWPPGSRSSRFQQIFKAAWDPLHLTAQADGVDIECFLSPPALIQDRGELLFYVNGRSVRNKGLVSCLRTAYQLTLGPHHEPSGVLYLDIRKDWVDVNVHPQKLEVRLLRQESLYSWLLASVRKELAKNRPMDKLEATPNLPQTELPWDRPKFDPPYPHRYAPPSEIRESNLRFDTPPLVKAGPRFLGQLAQSYLLCEDENGLWLLDQHGLSEYFIFSQLQKLPAQTQRLPVPQIVRFRREMQLALNQRRPLLESVGFEIDLFGDGDVVIKSAPRVLTSLTDFKARFESLLTELLQSANPVLDAPGLGAVHAALACHAAHPSNGPLSSTEIQALLQQIEKFDEQWACPHGRPVVFRLSFRDVEKYFKRLL